MNQFADLIGGGMYKVDFACPQCNRVTLVELVKGADLTRKVLHMSHVATGGKYEASMVYHVGHENILNYDSTVRVYKCASTKCDFELPVHDTIELYEWLLANKMIPMSDTVKKDWPRFRDTFIKQGQLSEEFLKKTHGALWTPDSPLP